MITLSIMILLGSVSYLLIRSTLMDKDVQQITTYASNAMKWYQEGGPGKLSQEFNGHKVNENDTLFIRLIDQSNQLVLVQHPRDKSMPDLTKLKQIPLDSSITWEHLSIDSNNSRWTTRTIRLGSAILQIGKNSTHNRFVLTALFDIYLIIGPIVILLCLMLNAVVAFRWTRPIRNITKAMKEILKTGEFDKKVPTYNKSNELDDLADLFNQLLSKNTTLIQGMHDSLNNVAHDLRTPMTRFRNSAEFAIQGTDPEVYREALCDCMEESEQILTMLNTLMNLAEAEAGTMKLNLQRCDITTIVANVIDLYEFIAEDKNISLQSDLSAIPSALVDPNRIHQILANLLDNAIKYSNSGKSVKLTAFADNTSFTMQIEDQGIGISEIDQEKIFERLYRCDRSRTERGLGLGLSLVQAVVSAHNGTIDVQSILNKGTTFTITLPLSQ